MFTLGVFDTGSFIGTRASGFAQITLVGWQVTPSGDFKAMFKNNAGTDITITGVNATLGSRTINNTSATPILNGEQTGQMTLGNFGTQSGSYTVRVSIAYNDTATGFAYTDTGTVSGRAT